MFNYSVIIPVFNRPDEIKELFDSLLIQEYTHFDIIIVEDGSTIKCEELIQQYRPQLDIKYFFKPNTGPGDSRNFGMEKATGDYIIFFDSDCLIPPNYFTMVEAHLKSRPLDAFGGPDNAHESFSDIQKAINFSMTSFTTTGGIRGKKNNIDQFQPRSFNMGIHKKVYQKVGGFSDLHPGEDPDLSYRIMDAGFKVGLIPEAFVYHKRRIDFSKFTKQVYKFGLVRTILMKWHPNKFKIVFLFPSLFLLGLIGLFILTFALSKIFILPIVLLIGIIFFEALFKTKNLWIAVLAIPASFIQLCAYGYGFLKGFLGIHILKLEERERFKDFFFFK